jgi:hypothetical protein
MLKERRMAAEQIAAALWDAEAAVDMAFSKTAAFSGAMPNLRRQAGASALIGQGAFEQATQAMMALAEARRALVEAHKELTLAKQQVGLGAVTMEDPGGTKPPVTIEGEVAAQKTGRALRAVRAA